MRKNKKRKRVFKFFIVFVLLVLVGLSSFYFFKPVTATGEEISIKNGDITTYYSFSGNIEAKNKEAIFSKKSMQIETINVENGEKVDADDVLLTTTTDEKILAGIKGEISEIKVEETQQIMPGDEVMTIIDYDELQLNVLVDEYDLKAAKIGKEVDATIHSLDKNIKGKIEEVSKEGENINGVTYFTAIISLTNDPELRIGMSAEAKILNESVKDAMLLNISSISFDNDNQAYVNIKDDNKKVRKDLEVGITDGVNVEIINGIGKDDVIIVPTDNSSNFRYGEGPGTSEDNNNQTNNTE